MSQHAVKMALLAAAPALLSLLTACSTTREQSQNVQHALNWPRVDLSQYDTIYIADCTISDPLAATQEPRDLVKGAYRRMADYTASAIDRTAFPTVVRRVAHADEHGVDMRIDITRYEPGSRMARGLLIGVGAAYLNCSVNLYSAGHSNLLGRVAVRDDFWAWGLLGESRGITLMEEAAATQVAAWLSICKGVPADGVLARLSNVGIDPEPVAPHGTIYIVRPQGVVGAAMRYAVGVDETTIGESRRKSYYVAYVTPGDHQVWWAPKDSPKLKPCRVESGGKYYFSSIGMVPLNEEEGLKAVGACELVRAMDLIKR